MWDFELPSEPSFRTAFGMKGAHPSALYNLEAQEMFAKRRVSLIRYGSTTTMGVNDWPARGLRPDRDGAEAELGRTERAAGGHVLRRLGQRLRPLVVARPTT